MDFNTIFHKFSSAISTIGQTILPQAKLKSGHNVNAQDIRVDTLPYIGIADKYTKLLHYYKANEELKRPYTGWYVNKVWSDRIKYICPTTLSKYILIPVDDIDRTTWRVKCGNKFQTGFIAPTDILNECDGTLSEGYEIRIYRTPIDGNGNKNIDILQNNGKWKFDYYAGILTFDSDFVPPSDIKVLYLQAFQYIGRTVSTLEKGINARLSAMSDLISSSINDMTMAIDSINSNISGITTDISTINTNISNIQQDTDDLSNTLSTAIEDANQQLSSAVDTITAGMLIIQPYEFTTQQLTYPSAIVEENGYKLGTYSITVPGFCFNVEAQIMDLSGKYYMPLETVIVDSKYVSGSTILQIHLDTDFIDDGYFPRISYMGSEPKNDNGKASERYYRRFVANSFEYKTGDGIVKMPEKTIVKTI